MTQEELNAQLIEAAYRENTSRVEELLDRGAEVDAGSDDGYTALYAAAEWGNADVVKLLLDSGAKVENAHHEILHNAATNGHEEVVKLLLDSGAKVDTISSNGCTALHWAAETYMHTTVELLLDRGADIEAITDDRNMSTPLELAIRQGFAETLEVLLRRGARQKRTVDELPDERENAAEDQEFLEDQHSKVEYLLAYGGAVPEDQDRRGNLAQLLTKYQVPAVEDLHNLLIHALAVNNFCAQAGSEGLEERIAQIKEQLDILRKDISEGNQEQIEDFLDDATQHSRLAIERSKEKDGQLVGQISNLTIEAKQKHKTTQDQAASAFAIKAQNGQGNTPLEGNEGIARDVLSFLDPQSTMNLLLSCRDMVAKTLFLQPPEQDTDASSSASSDSEDEEADQSLERPVKKLRVSEDEVPMRDVDDLLEAWSAHEGGGAAAGGVVDLAGGNHGSELHEKDYNLA